jgi:Chaperone of endosialidase
MNKLPDISEVEPLSEKDQPMIQDIIAVLRKHNALHRFGLTLLHQHFDTTDDEVMVEATDVEKREQTIAPMPKGAVVDLPVIETAWRLDTGKVMMSCMCIKTPKGDHWMHLPRPSDRRLKQDVQPLSDALHHLHQLRPVSYEYRQNVSPSPLPAGKQLGFIAQDVERVFPECVTEDATGFKRVDYISLIPTLVAAVQEQQQQIDALQTEVAMLRREIPSAELSSV